MEDFKLSGDEGYTNYEKVNWNEYDYRKTEGLESLKKCLNISADYGVWQEFYRNMNIEIAELYYKNGICCECNADKNKIYYTREVI